MSGMGLLIRDTEDVQRVPYQQYLKDYIKGSEDFMNGVRRGLRDRRQGRVKPWSKIRSELAIG